MMEEPDGTSTVKHYQHAGENWLYNHAHRRKDVALHGDAGRPDRDDDAVAGAVVVALPSAPG